VTGLDKARLLAVLVPAGLLAGAHGSQYLGGLTPCAMCYWQRWPHFAALGCALLSFLLAHRLPDRGRSLVWLAALAIVASGAIAVYHAGVELHIFEGFTQCAASGTRSLREMLGQPLVRCDQVQWSLLGISMAGWNAILSLGFGTLILWLSLRRPRIRT
jgi:disulfide bond formation protein DsbB